VQASQGRLYRILPADPACADGIDNDDDGFVDFPADAQCSSATDPDEAPACDDNFDNDADGLVDFPADPGCAGAATIRENPQCDDGVDNDGDGGFDWDGAGVGAADAQCAGEGWRTLEKPRSCGLGLELSLALPALLALRRTWRSRA